MSDLDKNREEIAYRWVKTRPEIAPKETAEFIDAVRVILDNDSSIPRIERAWNLLGQLERMLDGAMTGKKVDPVKLGQVAKSIKDPTLRDALLKGGGYLIQIQTFTPLELLSLNGPSQLVPLFEAAVKPQTED